MIRKLILRILVRLLRWVYKEATHNGDAALAAKADNLAEEIVSGLSKLS